MLNIFPFFGLITFNHPRCFKYFVLFQILATWIFFLARWIIPWNPSEHYRMSFLVAMFVFILTTLTSTVNLVETFRTIDKQKQLFKKLSDIDSYLNISQTNRKMRFLKANQLAFYVVSRILSEIAHLLLAYLYDNEGTYYYVFLADSVMRLRLFQITIWLDQFAARFLEYRLKLENM